MVWLKLSLRNGVLTQIKNLKEYIQAKKMWGITHLFPHNELVPLPYIAVATNTRADWNVKNSFLKE